MRIVGILCCVALLAAGGRGAAAQDSGPDGTSKEPGQIGIVIRISKELFEDMTRDVVEMTIPIEQRVEGNLLTGEASGKGVTHIEMTTSDEHAEFVMSLSGNALGKMRSDVGPAVVRMSSRATFITRKRIRFDGDDFQSESATANSRNCTTVDRICAKRRGPIGKIVEGIGRRMANKALPELNALAEKITGDLLVDTFDEMAVELVDELSQTSQFDEVVAKYFPETNSWRYRMATRPEFLVAGLGPASASFPSFLIEADDKLDSQMELWLRLTPGQAVLLELMGELDVTYDLLRGFLPEAESADLSKDVKIARRGDWSVITLGQPASEE